MPDFSIRAIRIVKGDRVFHVHGAGAGDEGVYLAKGQVHGLYDAPIKTTYKSGAFQEGSTHRFTKKMQRDLELGFHIKEKFYSWELNDSQFRRMFDYEEDRWSTSPKPTTIEVETDLSGIRKLDVLMYEEPEFAPDLDSMGDQYGNVIFKLRAQDPMWYQDTVVDSFSDEGSVASGFVTVSNPTDNVMYQKWVLTPANWAVSDYQWTGDPGEREPGGVAGDRVVTGVTVTVGNGGATIDLDRMNLMFRDANDTNILGQLGATRIFNFPIPPYTPPTLVAVGFSGAPAGGAMAQLRMPLRWSRPWGLEIPTDEQLSSTRPFETIFGNVGAYNYHIPSTATHIDIVLVGGGGGGQGAGLVNVGGLGGQWIYTTLIRGDNIPWETELITGSIGGGGGPGGFIAPAVVVPGVNGQPTTATGTGMTPLSAAGGLTTSSPVINGIGPNPTILNYNGRNYFGGPTAASQAYGNPPGGGGSGGLPLANGFAGARGQAWFYAYTAEEEGS
jgi:hypothetical protein